MVAQKAVNARGILSLTVLVENYIAKELAQLKLENEQLRTIFETANEEFAKLTELYLFLDV